MTDCSREQLAVMNGPIQRVMTATVIVATLGLGACGAPTPYQPAADGYGYAEQALEENRFRVSFSGNRLTSRETVENYLLYRAAEITVTRGFDHFVVAHWDTERKTTYFSTVPLTGYVGFGWYDSYGDPFGGFATARARPSDRYAAYANIVMQRGAKPAGDPDAYDARAVLGRLTPSLAIPSP